MKTLIFVAAGGAIGAAARHGVNLAWLRLSGAGFPGGTMIANIFGAVLMGVLAGYLLQNEMSVEMRAFLVVGVLGAFTTFSTFSLDTLVLFQRGEYAAGLFYVMGSIILAIAGVVGGMNIVKWVGAV